MDPMLVNRLIQLETRMIQMETRLNVLETKMFKLVAALEFIALLNMNESIHHVNSKNC